MSDELWREFLHPLQHCGLCGNVGVIDTRGQVYTPAGYDVGVLAFCICPNGRSLKEQGAAIHWWRGQRR